MKKTTAIPFHERIEEARKRAGISHDQLAHRAWTSSGYTHRICAGQAKPSRDIVIRLCLSLNLDVVETDLMLIAAGHMGLLPPQKELISISSPRGEHAFELDGVSSRLR